MVNSIGTVMVVNAHADGAVDVVLRLELHVPQLEQEGEQPQHRAALRPREPQRPHRRLTHTHTTPSHTIIIHL